MEDNNKEISVTFAIINNIPVDYHSADLRNYFSQFIEEKGFKCFHFRHRPEQVQDENGRNVLANQSSETKSKRSTCCVIKLTTKLFQKFLKMYQRKHWVDKNGDVMRQMCYISRIRQPCGADDSKFLTRAEQKQIPEERETFTLSDLQKLPELSPPDIMPNGNVGTPTMHFMDLIKQCRLPPKVIKKLGLTFPKTKTNKKYGNVPFNYGGDVVSLDDSDDNFQVCTAAGHEIPEFGDQSFKSKLADKEADGTADATKLDNEQSDTVTGTDSSLTGSSDQQDSTKQKGYIDKEMRQRMDLRIEEKMMEDEPGSDEDNDSCEEWERHEALYDDVSNQERNKERLFEEEIELKWEKGGSGLVFYTDAQYWQAQEGDFDEQTADDWDVDMSAYYEEGAGDKDIRDFLTIRQEKRRRDGIEATDRFTAGIAKRLKSKNLSKKARTEPKIGEFEEHTRGFGRRIMQEQGWTDGQGLGSSVQGIADALDNEGQNPRDRKGFGYHGEKLNRYHNKPAQRKVIISTIFDDPKQTDPHEPLNRRHEPYTLKYRDEIQFSKAKDS